MRDTIENSGADGIIKLHRKLHNADLPNGLPIKSTPNSISDKIDHDGKVLQRRVYGPDGMAKIDYDTSNHGRPKDHPTGAHKHILNHKLRNPHGNPLPLTEQELQDNKDIIKRGVNYFDEE